MHPRELVELAGIAAEHAPVLIDGVGRLSETGIEQYWAASRSRIDHWTTVLTAAADDGSPARQPRWKIARAVIEEVLSGEMLTRVWTAVVCACDRRHGATSVEPIVRSVLKGHLEARRQALSLLVEWPEVIAHEALQLNQLRRRTERWTDFLLGYLLESYEVSEFAIDVERAEDFSEHARQVRRTGALSCTSALPLASLRLAFAEAFHAETFGNEANARIAAGVLSCFPCEMFDSIGLARSLWSVRMCHTANDTQVLIEELLHGDGHCLHRGTESSTPRTRPRYRPGQ